jgi:isopenicillin-N epimerase
MQMAAFPLPPCDVDAVKRRLYDEFAVEIPVYSWNGQPLIRLSVQGYNTQAEVDALLEGLEVLLPRTGGEVVLPT